MARKSASDNRDRSPTTGATDAEAVAAILHWISNPDNALPTQLKHRVVDLMGSALRAPAQAQSRVVEQPRRCLVYVHGICPHPPGFSNDWWEALHPFTGVFGDGRLDDTRREVVWNDVRHVAAPDAALTAAACKERAEFAARIRGALEDRAAAFAMQAGPSTASPELARKLIVNAWLENDPARQDASKPDSSEPPGLTIPGITCLSDITDYMFDDAARQRTLDVFSQVIEPLLEAGSDIDLIAHSWGTVVAYEGLRALEANAGPGRVRNLFTVGAALSLFPVKLRLRPENRDGRRPAMVDRWININAHGDPVGGPLQNNPYQVDVEYLGLANLGCGFLDGSCAHSSYFIPQNTVVNQEIFARFINPS
jgi:hypothetical protein